MDRRTIALLLACFLGSMALLGSGSSPPDVQIPQIPQLEDGMKVRVSGLLVDLWKYESGAESLVLADPASSETVKVVSSPASRPQPSRYVDIGDELSVLGELSASGTARTIFSTSDGITVSKESEETLTVDILRDNWILFEGDGVRLRGILNFDGLGVGLRLYNIGMNSSLSLDIGQLEVQRLLGSRVLVTGVLGFDSRILCLELMVTSISGE